MRISGRSDKCRRFPPREGARRAERRRDLRRRRSGLTERSHCSVISFHLAQVFILVIDNNLKGVVEFWRIGAAARPHAASGGGRRREERRYERGAEPPRLSQNRFWKRLWIQPESPCNVEK